MHEPPSPSVLYAPSPEGITTITINRPHVKNAVNHSTSLLLASAFREFEADPTQKVCIFTGAGDAFCAGYDLHELAHSDDSSTPSPSAPSSPALKAQPVDFSSSTALAPMGPSRFTPSKPVIAAILGPAVAGGLELSLLAHIRIADTTAIFGVFCRRFGVPLIDGGTVRLAKVVGLGRALDMVLTGRAVHAEEALAFGLANRVVEKGAAVRAAREMAAQLAAFPERCMRADLASVQYAAFEARSLEDALRFEFENGARVVEEESVNGARRFHGGEGRGGSFTKSKL